MAIELAKKFSPKVQESFRHGSYTDVAVNKDYDFIGVQTVKIYKLDTVDMHNYNASGTTAVVPNTSRYGTADEFNATTQELPIKVDRSFTFVIDKLKEKETMGVLNPGAALKRQIEERIIPEIDKYRLAKIVSDAKAASNANAITNITVDKATAYEKFLEGVTFFLENQVPLNGAFAYISPNFYKLIRTCPEFIRNGDLSQEMLVKGQVGMIDGIPLILLPQSYFPKNDASATWSQSTGLSNLSDLSGKSWQFLIVNREATVGVEKLVDYKVHDNPPGVNGWLIEGRLVYDAFVLDRKAKMIYGAVTTP